MKATINDTLPAETNTVDLRRNNGGARKGAGRKSQNKVNMTFSINEDIAAAAATKHKGRLSGKVEGYLKRISK